MLSTEKSVEKLSQMKFPKFTKIPLFGNEGIIFVMEKFFFSLQTQMKESHNKKLLTSIMTTICDTQCLLKIGNGQAATLLIFGHFVQIILA